ncbi:MAG: 2-oxo acid dehydrogenase subunit E2 [Dehalococcoidia bacterium]
MTHLAMPQLGESVTEGTIIKWLKNLGDHVQMDEALVEIETEKVNVEIPSPFEGVLTEILVPEGETVAVGTDLASIETASSPVSPEGETISPSAGEETAMFTAVPLGDDAAGEQTAVEASGLESPDTRDPTLDTPSNGSQQRYSPAVLTLAQEHQIDLRQVPGSGLSGRVTRKDVLVWLERHESTAAQQPTAELPSVAAIQESAATPAQAGRPPLLQGTRSLTPGPSPASLDRGEQESSDAASPAPAPMPAPQSVPAAGPSRVSASPLPAAQSLAVAGPSPIFLSPAALEGGPGGEAAADEEIARPSATRRAIAQHMVRSVQTSPHAWMVVEIDLTGLVRYRESIKADFRRREGIDLSYLPFMIKATVQALKEIPRLNSTWRDGDVVLKRRVNIGIAVNTDEGLMVPVIHDADNYSIAGLARMANDLAARARSRRLKLEDVQGGTFTVDNTGVFGSVVSAPIINQPQAAIVTMEAIVKRPVVVDDTIAIRSIMNSCISFDHRVVDGGEVGPFMQSLKRHLQTYGEGTPLY